MINRNDKNYLHKCSKCGIEKPNTEYNKKGDSLRRIRLYSSVCRDCNKGSWKKYSNSLTRKKYKLNYFFGLSYEDWEKMVELHNGCCAICGTNENVLDRNLAIDHNHKTGKVRGLLCNHCNLGLGKFNDDIELLQKAINYLYERDK